LIRPATPADEPALIEQFTLLNRVEEALIHNRRVEEGGGEPSLRHSQRRIAESNGIMLVLELEGRVMGHLALVYDRHPPFVREEFRDYAYVAELFVREELRGKGHGRALLAEAERLARERGMPSMVLGVLTGNDPAIRSYEAYGFRPFATDMVKPLT